MAASLSTEPGSGDRCERPWGWYETLASGGGYLVKRLWIAPGRRISLQRHLYRSEHWVIVGGGGTVEIDGREQAVQPGDTLLVPLGAVHRATAAGDGLAIVEVQRGEQLREDDIERLADDYGRLAASPPPWRKDGNPG
ncbi:MAG: phosphomannose isomerase type II C-terminal cupin domain [Cyanobacteriota bacterium]